MVRADNGYNIFVKHLSGGEFAVGVFNFCGDARSVEITFAELGVPCTSGVRLQMTHVISGEDLGIRHDDYFFALGGHSARIIRCRFVNA